MTQVSVKGVFLDASTLGADIDLSPLQALSCRCWDMTAAEDVIDRAKEVDYIVTNKVMLTDDIISNLPNLKLICVAATGINNIDLQAAKRRGIEVKNVTDYAGTSIAQLVFSYISELLLHTSHYAKLVKQGVWSDSPHFCVLDKPFVELARKKIGLIGYGSLAKSVERVAKAYDMQVLIAEHKGAQQARSGRHLFTEVIKQADIVSIHCPLTTETENLIGALELTQMKNTAVLINTARGGIVNEADLLEALSNKVISAAATDVLTEEPPKPDHLMLSKNLDNLIVTPHIAWATVEARKRVMNEILCNIKCYFDCFF